MYYSVVIVEDELLLRTHYVEDIDWASCSCKVVYHCESAEQALAYMEQNGYPDLLFTDIHLPQASGIELCRSVFAANPFTQKVILSGYDTFDYAKQAIQYRVTNYLLKPIDAQEVLTTVAGLTANLLRERHSQQEIEELRLFVQSNRPALTENFFIELSCATNGLSNGLYQSFLKRLDICLCNYFYIVLRYKCPADENALEMKLQLKKYFYEQMSFYGQCFCFTFEYEKISCIFMPSREVAIDEIVQDAINRISLFSDRLCVSAGISLPQSDYTFVRAGYEQASTALNYDFYFGYGSVTQYQALFEDKKRLSSREAFDSEAVLQNLKIGNWETSLAILAERCTHLRSAKNIRQAALQSAAIELASLIFGSVNEALRESLPATPAEQMLRITQATSLDDVQAQLAQMISDCGRSIQARFLNHTHNAVEKILYYLNEHYQEQITLEDLAGVVYLNTKYICNIVKKDTGKTFHELLIGIRIEKAKALILSGQHKMYEISQHVGFSDSKAFNHAFKKLVGVTPTLYRSQCVGEAQPLQRN